MEYQITKEIGRAICAGSASADVIPKQIGGPSGGDDLIT
jgi:hypothetical protein